MGSKIYTRKGDLGQTRLFSGEKVSKDDLRLEAYGALDELQAHLGMARSLTKNPELAHKLLAYATSSKPLADLSKWIPYGPARKSSIAFVGKDVLPNLPTAPQNSKDALSFGTKWWADHADEMNERFAAGMSH